MADSKFKVGDIVDFISSNSLNAEYFTKGLRNLTIKSVKGDSLAIWESDGSDWWAVNEEEVKLSDCIFGGRKKYKRIEEGMYDMVKYEVEDKMKEPKTKLEIKACEKAKNEAVQRAIEAKQKIYDRGMVDLINAKQKMINLEADLVEVKKEYKELAIKLKITKEDEKSLF